MKKMLVLVVVLGVLLAGCNYKGHIYEALGYCEANGRYYYTRDGKIRSARDCSNIRGEDVCFAFEGTAWCPYVEPKPEPTPTPEPRVPSQPIGCIMWLLTRDDNACMLVSETHPSVERQQVLCGWVADRAPCAGDIFDNDYWVCDEMLGENDWARLPLNSDDGSRDLVDVCRMHEAREQ